MKCADYILTPLAGGSLVAQLRGSGSLWRKLLAGVLALNTVFQLVSAFTGWMLIVDAQHRYVRGPLYRAYFLVCLLVIVLTILEFHFYGRHFRRQNKLSLYAILFMVVAGILMQELLGGGIRTSYLALTLGMALMFIHVEEFSQLEADDRIEEQNIQITTDPLTGVLNRYAYTRAMKAMDTAGQVPERLAVFSIDINGLKEVNDTLGHEAGDELIRGAARCIVTALGQWGKCYRTGGDEFIVLAEMDWDTTYAALELLHMEAESWHGEKAGELHLAAGCVTAEERPGLSVEKLVVEVDQAMYARKAAYYRQAGNDRRQR